jgi:DedD protein
MAEKDSEPTAFNPKHRIIGAIVLVALAVILVPLVLDEREPPSDLKGISEIPARQSNLAATETKVVVTPVANLANPEKNGPNQTPTDSTKTPATSPAETTVVETQPETPAEPAEKSKTAKPKTQAKASEAEKTKAAVPAKGWIVQVGVYSNADNAARVSEKLKSHGLAVTAESVKIEGGKAMRLRVGPYRERAAALKAQAQIQKEVGVQGMVLAYP